jgi:hypothetical protein
MKSGLVERSGGCIVRRDEERAPRGARNGGNEMRMRLLLLAVLAVGLLAMPTTAMAAKAPTEVDSFKAKPGNIGQVKYSGKISSSKGKCYKNRRYEIVHNGVVIVSGRTDDQGKFSRTGPEPPDGDKVTLKILPKKGCKTTSKSVTYDSDD